ncbi:50S ribosomal protein L13 [Candidatus Gracilibacteria bacterium]|nr:50S ribosomal protein L13 [Candidatus Gracilibacteria bacterium]MCF7819380.1 50S ribosomal protein L13 [Candidatus Gracilibacteria bacterium]
MKKTTIRQNVQKSDRTWFVADAKDKRLGKVAAKIATILNGKYRPDYTPHVDGGDYVVVLNADKIQLSGNKEEQKEYFSHSRYLGHLKVKTASEMRKKSPLKILEAAVYGMLPKTKHRKAQMQRLFLVIGEENPHEAQKPKSLSLES